MARAALRWTVRELAAAAHINHNTVIRFENERHEPNDTTRLMIKQAFEAGGLAFIDADETAGEGVRLKASAEAKEPAEEQQYVEESAASLLAREEGLRASKRKGKV
jgi:DNA-binding XRE family transcriptional regulator